MTTTPDAIKAAIREAGGMVHSDGNIFFTNAVQFLKAAIAADKAVAPDGWVLVPREFLAGFNTLAHNYSLKAIAPDYYSGTERDAFKSAYARCGNDLAKLSAMIAAAPATLPASQWRDIATAPEGIMILCANMKAMEAKSWAYVAWIAGGRVCGHRMDMPTHWQPLPPAPEPVGVV